MKYMLTPRTTVFVAALLGAFGVVSGAFGSHILADALSPKSMGTYTTGVTYLQGHALYLFVLGWVSLTHDNAMLGRARLAGLLGILVFSGSLMVLAVTGMSWLGAVAPVGGTLLILSWLATAFGARQWAAGHAGSA